MDPPELLAARYRLEQELAQGGMAAIWTAFDTKHQRRVAVKLLDDRIAQALGADRFLREIEIAASLQHPHITALVSRLRLPSPRGKSPM